MKERKKIVNIQEIEKALDFVKGFGPVGEFHALQDIMVAYTVRGVASPPSNPLEVYNWYLEKLLDLHDRLASACESRGVPYRLERYDPLEMALARVRAILDTLPEVESEQMSTTRTA